MSSIDPAFLIYVDRLRDGQTESIDDQVPPDFLEVEDDNLRFDQPVKFTGQAYLAQQELILNLEVRTPALMPCRICNEWTEFAVHVPHLLHVEPTDELKRGYVDLRPVLREAILLQLPHTVECSGGHCPKRKEIQPYLKDGHSDSSSKNEGYKPFEHLN